MVNSLVVTSGSVGASYVEVSSVVVSALQRFLLS